LEEGSQQYMGNTADLMPNTIMKKQDVIPTRVLFCNSWILSARSAIFSEPVMPYKMPIPVKKNIEARKIIAIYLTAPSSCAFLHPRVISTKEEMIITSK